VTNIKHADAYHCLLGGPYHIDESCPLGRAIPAELRGPGPGSDSLCRTCELRLEAGESRRRMDGG
jgi:hypothetical protein